MLAFVHHYALLLPGTEAVALGGLRAATGGHTLGDHRTGQLGVDACGGGCVRFVITRWVILRLGLGGDGHGLASLGLLGGPGARPESLLGRPGPERAAWNM